MSKMKETEMKSLRSRSWTTCIYRNSCRLGHRSQRRSNNITKQRDRYTREPPLRSVNQQPNLSAISRDQILKTTWQLWWLLATVYRPMFEMQTQKRFLVWIDVYAYSQEEVAIATQLTVKYPITWIYSKWTDPFFQIGIVISFSSHLSTMSVSLIYLHV